MRTIPIPVLTESDRVRFLAKIAPSDENGCETWTAGTRDGYGRFKMGSRRVPGSMKNYNAHRVAYTLFVGVIPNGIEVDHTCFNHACCAIGHLRLVTHKQNQEHLRGARVDNIAGVLGVGQAMRDGRLRWRARVRHDSHLYHFGWHDSPEEAEAAVIAGRMSLFTHNDLDRVLPL